MSEQWVPTVFPQPIPPAMILVVDDAAVERELLREHLWANGLKVRLACDGEDAIRHAHTDVPDLILLDVVMPGMDGFETCRRLKLDATTRDIPVIFMTALEGTANKLQGFSVGAVDYLTKPIDPAEMLARIGAHLNLAHTRKALEAEIEARRRTEVALRERTEQAQKALDRLMLSEHLLVNEKLAAVGQLSTGIAHEINNPVNYSVLAAEQLDHELHGFQDFLLELAGSEAEPEVLAAIVARFGLLREHVRTIKEGGARVLAIVRDLGLFARADGDLEVDTRIETALQSTLNLVQAQYRHEVKFATDFAPTPQLRCNPGRINQVFMNLLVNACQSIRERAQQAEPGYQGQVLVSTSCDGAQVRIDVRDNGMGMSVETQRRLFEPFFTTKPAGVGTGLGLAVSWGIVKAHGGRIEVATNAQQGASFSVCLPVHAKPMDDAEDPPEAGNGAAEWSG